jgi:hypothetical protein
VDYLVGTASGALSAEIVVGTTPSGELGGTWASPTVDATHSGSAHHAHTDIVDLPTAEMDDTLVLAPDGAGGVEFRAEAGGGGVSGVTFPIVAVFDSSPSAIIGNPEVDVVIPAAGTITGWTLLADVAGGAIIDIWSDTYGNFPPTDADSITAAVPPTLTAAAKATGADPAGDGWDVALTAGDVLRFHLDSSSTVTRLVLTLTYTRS